MQTGATALTSMSGTSCTRSLDSNRQKSRWRNTDHTDFTICLFDDEAEQERREIRPTAQYEYANHRFISPFLS